VILVNFVFADESGIKKRPAVIISNDIYQRGRDEIIIAAVTSRTDRLLPGDGLIAGWQSAGLLFPSTATGILRTIKQSMVARKLGRLSDRDMENMEQRLTLILKRD